MKYLPQLLDYAYSLKDKPMESMLITAEMESEYIPDSLENVHLDGLLSKAVTYKIPCNFKESERYFIPLPLLILGENKEYYCCSCGIPGEKARGSFYWRKRSDLHVPQKIRMGAGAYKAYNVRHDTIHTNHLRFLAHGIKREIEELLDYISNIGKKRNYGKGEVREWAVEPIDNSAEDCIIHKNQVLRPIPISEITSESPIIRASYYPPYWHPGNETDCYVPILGGM